MMMAAGAGAAMASGPYVLGGLVAAISGGGGYGWDGSENTAFRAALQTTSNFGAGGKVSVPISTVNITDTGNLTGIQGLVIPWWLNSSASATQVNQVVAFFHAGGDLLIGQDSSSNDPVGIAIGVPTIDNSGNIWTPSGFFAAGPFGPVGTFNTSGEYGYFTTSSITSTNGTVASRDASSNITTAVWPKGVFCPTCGALAIIADIDVWTTQANYTSFNNDALFSLNVVAYILQNSGNFVAPPASAPPTTPAPTSLWLALIGLMSAGLYYGYRNRHPA